MNFRAMFSEWVRPKESILFITLDSCRYDTFMASDAPLLKSIGTVHRVQAPAHFTYGSHAAMFVGFTPGDPFSSLPLVNPKVGKFFRLTGGGSGPGEDWMTLDGANVMEGLQHKGYTTVGSGAVGWFNDSTSTGRVLAQGFDRFFYSGNTFSLKRQVNWLLNEVNGCQGPVFAFLNVGETHVPYYFEGAPWAQSDNPCRAVRQGKKHSNNADEAARRQRLCVEYVDRQLEPLLQRFAESNIIVCADHGDCWGEDGCWEHGISHPKVLEVPLLFHVL